MDLDQVIDTCSSLSFPALAQELQLHPEYLACLDASGNYLSHALCERKLFSLLIDLYQVKGDTIGLCQNASGKTVLHMLASARHVDVFQSVLQPCPGALALTDNCQRLPAHLTLDFEALALSCQLMAQYSDFFDPWLQDKYEKSFLSRFDDKFFAIQKMCWERAIKGDFDSYNMIKSAADKAYKLVSAAKRRSKLRNISDIRVMKELKISILHEAAVNADMEVLIPLLEQEKDLCTYSDMSGMCPLMRLLASPSAEIGKITLFASKPYVLFDATRKSLLHHILLNRATDSNTKLHLFDLICKGLSPSDLAASFTAIEKTGHTLLSLALLYMPIAFIRRVIWVYMGLVGTWEELFGGEQDWVEYPLVSAMKSEQQELVRVILEAGFRLLEQPRGNSSPLFTLFRRYNEAIMRTCLDFCERRKQEFISDVRVYMENMLKKEASRLATVIEPVLSSLNAYSPLPLLTYCYVLQTLSHEKTHFPSLPISLPASLSSDFSLLSLAIQALLSCEQPLTLYSLLQIPRIAQLLSSVSRVLPLIYADKVCKLSAPLTLLLFSLGYTVHSELKSQSELDYFIDNVLLTRGKSYHYIQALFSLLEHASTEGKAVIEATLILRSKQNASVIYDLVQFYTNVYRHYQSYKPVWTNVLFGILKEDDFWGSRLIISVLIALSKDGLVQLPMSILSQYAQLIASDYGKLMPVCDHCHKVTTDEERPLRVTTGEVKLSDQRNELFFLITALEACEGEINDHMMTQGYSRLTQKEILSMLIRCMKGHGASKLYFNRPYKYQGFVREWFEGLALCTCYLGASSTETKG